MFRGCHAFLSVHRSLVVACWERADLLVLLFVSFTCALSHSNEQARQHDRNET